MRTFSLPDPLDLGIDDDQHDYDSVASDEDTDSELTTQNNNNIQRSNRAKVQYLKKPTYKQLYKCWHTITFTQQFSSAPFT